MEILLVEDNEDDILLEQEALADAKLVNLMCVVRDGEEAMAYLRRRGKYQNAKMPGLILLDINMPKKNGFEVLIKSDAALMHIPVIMLTTSDGEADIVKSYAKGAAPISRNRWTLPNSETWSSGLLYIGYWWLRFRRGRD